MKQVHRRSLAHCSSASQDRNLRTGVGRHCLEHAHREGARWTVYIGRRIREPSFLDDGGEARTSTNEGAPENSLGQMLKRCSRSGRRSIMARARSSRLTCIRSRNGVPTCTHKPCFSATSSTTSRSSGCFTKTSLILFWRSAFLFRISSFVNAGSLCRLRTVSRPKAPRGEDLTRLLRRRGLGGLPQRDLSRW